MDTQAALDAIAADAERGDIVFPTHTDMALQVQRLLDDPDCNIEALGKLVAAEPILAARVIGTANSISFNPSGKQISDIKNAIARLGFSTLRALTASIIVRQMKELSKSEACRNLSSRLWEHTAHVASLARVIARRITRQNPDAAFFAGIVHEIGAFYLISRADAWPGLLSGDLTPWHGEGEARLGRAVLHALDIPAPVLEAIEILWGGYLAMPPVSLGDTLLLADEISSVESPLDALAGMGRKGIRAELELAIDEETLSSILAESADEVTSLTAVLRS